MLTANDLKLAAGLLVVLGVAIGFLNAKRAPHALLLESSPARPAWLPWLSWGLSAAASLAYVAIDYLNAAPLERPTVSTGAVAYWAFASFASLFYGFNATKVFGGSAEDKPWEWRLHQFWFNFAGSAAGWALAWPFVQSFTRCLWLDCVVNPSPSQAATFLVAFVGITGHLPVSVIGLVGGLRELVQKLLGSSQP